jgi:predicted extracellular nuclease
MIKKIVIFCITTMLSGFVSAQCNELFISEYVEGSRNNKALEIYNPTDKPVDLSQYRVTRWQNGSAAWTAQMSDALSGTLKPKDVVVIVLDRRDTTKIGQDTPVVLSLRLKADLFLSKDYNLSLIHI